MILHVRVGNNDNGTTFFQPFKKRKNVHKSSELTCNSIKDLHNSRRSLLIAYNGTIDRRQHYARNDMKENTFKCRRGISEKCIFHLF